MSIDSIISQRNNLLANINDVERTKERMTNVCHLLRQVASCVDALTVIHRFVSHAKDAFSLADVKYITFSGETGMLMSDRGALDVYQVAEREGALRRCIRLQEPVHMKRNSHIWVIL